jgi:hypothetical protein
MCPKRSLGAEGYSWSHGMAFQVCKSISNRDYMD